jgi:hypothetical protein
MVGSAHPGAGRALIVALWFHSVFHSVSVIEFANARID